MAARLWANSSQKSHLLRSHLPPKTTGIDLFDLVNEQGGMLATGVRLQNHWQLIMLCLLYILYAHLAELSSVPPSVLHSHLSPRTQLLLQKYYLVLSAQNKHICIMGNTTLFCDIYLEWDILGFLLRLTVVLVPAEWYPQLAYSPLVFWEVLDKRCQRIHSENPAFRISGFSCVSVWWKNLHYKRIPWQNSLRAFQFIRTGISLHDYDANSQLCFHGFFFWFPMPLLANV